MHALRRFGSERVEWGGVFAWCVAVARNLAVTQLRRERLARVSSAVAVDELAVPRVERSFPRDAVVAWTGQLRSVLSGPDNETLDLLLAGVDDNAEIARLRGRCIRAVQASRARIAAAAHATEFLLTDARMGNSSDSLASAVSKVAAHGKQRASC